MSGLLVAARTASTPLSDAEIMAALEADRAGFVEIVEHITADPIISHVRRSRDGTWKVSPQVDPARAKMVTDFLEARGVESASADPDGPRSVRFVFHAEGLGAAGRMKSLDYGPLEAGDLIVADTDVVMSKPSRSWRVAVRRIDEEWYVRHACC